MGKKRNKKKAAKKPKQASRKESATPERQHVYRAFTVKQQKFIDAYAGDIKEAAKKAELSYGYARRLVTKSNIFEAIRHRQDTEIRPKTIANRQQRQEFWTKVMRDENEDTKDRLRVSELLGKSEADFVEHTVLGSDDALTDEECEHIREILRKNFEAAALYRLRQREGTAEKETCLP